MRNNIFISLIAFVTIVLCISIALNISPLLRGPAPYPPDWQWTYDFVNTMGRIWMPLIACLLLFSYSYFWERRHETVIRFRTIFLLVLLCYLLQLTVLYFSRSGIGVLFARIAHPDHNGYFTQALEIKNMYVFFHEYAKHVLSFYQHAQGHPPFSILFFWIIDRVCQTLPFLIQFTDSFAPSRPDILVLWNELLPYQRLSAIVSGFLIPLLSCSAVIPIYLIGKYLYDNRTAVRAAYLYAFVPSVLLFIPINDTFLSLFPLWSLYFFLKSVKQKNYKTIFFAGIIFSIGIQFSLSLLPLLLLFLAFFLSSWKGKDAKIFSLGVMFTAGLISVPLLLYLVYGYNFFEVSRVIMTGLPEQRKYATWVLFNLFDFFIFAGIPICILSFGSLLNAINQFFVNRYLTLLPLSFFCMLFVLDISGSVRGEVARIWLPFYPFLALIAAAFMKERKFTTNQFLLVLILQAIQLFVMQEYWVTLW